MDSEEILKNNRNAVQSIFLSTGIADGHFKDLYQYPIDRAAELVQSCPVSRDGHHAWPGGLIAHALESCANALRMRKSVLLPVGASPEARKTKADLYTYAVFSATLLHDIGIAMDTQVIRLLDWRRRYLCDWNPLLEDIGAHPKARYMEVRFREDPVKSHGGMSALMYINRVLPKLGICWIRDDPVVYGEFMDALSDNPSGPIHKLMVKAYLASEERVMGHSMRPTGEQTKPAGAKFKEEPSAKEGWVQNPSGRRALKPIPASRLKTRRGSSSATKSRENPDKTIPDPNQTGAGESDREPDIQANEVEKTSPGEEFRKWVESGINDATLSFNDDGALIHVVDNAMLLLVVPSIFERYATERSMRMETAKHDFAALGIHIRNVGKSENDQWQARISREGKISMIKGWLLPIEHLNLQVDLAINDQIKIMNSHGIKNNP